MSSADPTRLRRASNSLRCAFSGARPLKDLPVCLFQAFKERVSHPVGETWWLAK